MSSEPRADQIECTRRVLDVTPDAAIVSNLGIASYALAAVGDRDRNLYLWGSMGCTTPTGLGLALATDEQVTVLDGDGSMLMGLGALATVSDRDPSNLAIVVFDNGTYETTGGQPTVDVDLAGVARECGVRSEAVTDADDFEAAYQDAVSHGGAALVSCAVEPIEPTARPPLDYPSIARRVREALEADR